MDTIMNRKILTGLVCAFSICIFTPYIANYYAIIPFVLGMAIVVYMLFSAAFKISSLMLFPILLVTLSILYKLFGISSASMGNYGKRVLIIVAFAIGIYANKRMCHRNKKICVYISIITIIFNAIYNIWLYIIAPEMFSAIRSSDYYVSKYGYTNIVGTEYGYVFMFLSLMLITIFVKKSKQLNYKHRILMLLIIIFFSLYLLAYGRSATVLLSYIMGIILMYVFRGSLKDNIIKTVFLIIIFIILFLFQNIFFELLISSLTGIVNDKILTRLQVLFNMFSGDEAVDGSNYFARFFYLQLDIQTWLSSIKTLFIGTGLHLQSVNYSGIDATVAAISTGAGNHSGFVDILPRYGIVGFGLLFGAIRSFWVFLKKSLDYKKIATVLFILIIINNIINSTFEPTVMFTIAFLVPGIYDLYFK